MVHSIIVRFLGCLVRWIYGCGCVSVLETLWISDLGVFSYVASCPLGRVVCLSLPVGMVVCDALVVGMDRSVVVIVCITGFGNVLFISSSVDISRTLQLFRSIVWDLGGSFLNRVSWAAIFLANMGVRS